MQLLPDLVAQVARLSQHEPVTRQLLEKAFPRLEPLPFPRDLNPAAADGDVPAGVQLFLGHHTVGQPAECLIALYTLAWESNAERQHFQQAAQARGGCVFWDCTSTTLVEILSSSCCSAQPKAAAQSKRSVVLAVDCSSAGGGNSDGSLSSRSSSSSTSSSGSSTPSECRRQHVRLLRSIQARWEQRERELQQQLQERPSATTTHWGLAAAFRSMFPGGPPQTPRTTRLNQDQQPVVPALEGSRGVPQSHSGVIATTRQYFAFHTSLGPHMPAVLEQARKQLVLAVETQLPRTLLAKLRRALSRKQRDAEAAAVSLVAHSLMFDAATTVGPALC